MPLHPGACLAIEICTYSSATSIGRWFERSKEIKPGADASAGTNGIVNMLRMGMTEGVQRDYSDVTDTVSHYYGPSVERPRDHKSIGEVRYYGRL